MLDLFEMIGDLQKCGFDLYQHRGESRGMSDGIYPHVLAQGSKGYACRQQDAICHDSSSKNGILKSSAAAGLERSKEIQLGNSKILTRRRVFESRPMNEVF
jgi:hypothetical protein